VEGGQAVRHHRKEGERHHGGGGRGEREGGAAHTRTKNGETTWTTMEGSSPEKTEFAGAEKKIID
jgi:hypothetical protein